MLPIIKLDVKKVNLTVVNIFGDAVYTKKSFIVLLKFLTNIENT